MIITCIPGGSFMENCYIIGDEEACEAILVDPGEQVSQIRDEIKESGLKFTKIINTHTHLDHVAGVDTFKKELGIPFYIHKEDQAVLDFLPAAVKRYPGFDFVEKPKVDGYVDENDTIEIGNLKGKILHVPGHSWGHICFVFEKHIIAGDTVFAGSVGRVDLTGGTSMEELIGSIMQKIMVYPDDFKIYSGHGPSTTVGIEKMTNPFLQGAYVNY
ncbi:MAG: MBL fold metallo-hydrolase [Thermodesulfobacteriota bacterium]